MSDIDFLIGRTVVEVRDEERLVFELGPKREPRLYADVGEAVCLDCAREPLGLAGLVDRTVATVSVTDGSLRMAFTDGATLQSDPGPELRGMAGRRRLSALAGRLPSGRR